MSLPVGAQILALTMGHVFSNAVRTLPAVSADVLSRDLGIGTETLSAITGAFPLAFALAMIPVGVALDRWGSRLVAMVLLGIAATGAVLAAFATGPLSMVVAQSIIGIGCSGMMMAPMAFAARSMPVAQFGVWAGIVQATGNSGMLLSASPLAWLVDASGWRAGFFACAALAALAFCAVALLVRETPPGGGRKLMDDAKAVVGFGFSPALMPAMALAFVSFGAMLGMRGLWGGPWLMEVKGFTRIETGNLLLLLAAALVAGPFLAGLVGRALGRLVLLLATGHLLAAGFIVALVLAGGMDAPWLDGLLLVGYGLSITYQVSLFALVQGRVTPDVAGRALSAMNVFFFGGAAVMQAAMGLAAFWGGVAAALLFIAAALVLGVLAFLLLERRFRAAGKTPALPDPVAQG